MAILKNTTSTSISVDYLNIKESFLETLQIQEIDSIENTVIPQGQPIGYSEPVFLVQTAGTTLQPFGKVTYFLIDATNGSLSLNLPDLQQYTESISLYIKRFDSTSNTISIQGKEASQTIDGETIYTITTKPSVALIIVNKNNKWYII